MSIEDNARDALNRAAIINYVIEKSALHIIYAREIEVLSDIANFNDAELEVILRRVEMIISEYVGVEGGEGVEHEGAPNSAPMS